MGSRQSRDQFTGKLRAGQLEAQPPVAAQGLAEALRARARGAKRVAFAVATAM